MVDVPPVIEWIQSLEALLLFPLELLIMGEWKSTKHELQLLISGSLDGQVPIGNHISSDCFVCNTYQCSHLDPVHSDHCSVCSSIFSHTVLCLSLFELVG